MAKPRGLDSSATASERRVAKALTRSEVMSRIRGTNTGPEVALRHALWSMGFRYRLKAPLPGRPDIVFPRHRVAVFVDGCFWHGCRLHYTAPTNNHEFWAAKLVENRTRDVRVAAALKARGWQVIRLWEHDVDLDPVRAARRVKRKLR